MEKVIIEILLIQSQEILHEANENPTVDKTWKTGMKVAVGFILDRVYEILYSVWRGNQIIDESMNDEDYRNSFDSSLGYDGNEQEEKRYERLNKYFISLNTNSDEH